MTPARKKIIITMTYMHIGGAERSLLGLLHASGMESTVSSI